MGGKSFFEDYQKKQKLSNNKSKRSKKMPKLNETIDEEKSIDDINLSPKINSRKHKKSCSIPNLNSSSFKSHENVLSNESIPTFNEEFYKPNIRKHIQTGTQTTNFTNTTNNTDTQIYTSDSNTYFDHNESDKESESSAWTSDTNETDDHSTMDENSTMEEKLDENIHLGCLFRYHEIIRFLDYPNRQYNCI